MREVHTALCEKKKKKKKKNVRYWQKEYAISTEDAGQEECDRITDFCDVTAKMLKSKLIQYPLTLNFSSYHISQ